MTEAWIFVAITLVASLLFLRWLMGAAGRLRLDDIPNRRSSHHLPVPKGGGAAFVLAAGILMPAWLWWTEMWTALPLGVFWGCAMMVGLTGWLDDRFELPQLLRFGVEAVAAVAVIGTFADLGGFYLPMAGVLSLGAVAGGLLAFVWITGTVNIYNFMDGIDGMAGQQALAAAAGWLWLSRMWGQDAMVVINLLLLASLLPFLWYNRPPARVFMGDTGSLFLGFVFAAMPFLASTQPGGPAAPEALWIGAIMLWPFLFDGAWTLLRRLFNGENLLHPHRSHLYQRLHITGWTQGRVSLLYFGFSVISAGAAILFAGRGGGGRAGVLALMLALSLGLAAFVAREERVLATSKSKRSA